MELCFRELCVFSAIALNADSETLPIGNSAPGSTGELGEGLEAWHGRDRQKKRRESGDALRDRDPWCSVCERENAEEFGQSTALEHMIHQNNSNKKKSREGKA